VAVASESLICETSVQYYRHCTRSRIWVPSSQKPKTGWFLGVPVIGWQSLKENPLNRCKPLARANSLHQLSGYSVSGLSNIKSEP